MERESVLEIEFKPVWDKWAWKITKQNEEVLEREEFLDEEFEVMSGGCAPDFVEKTGCLFIRGGDEEGDDNIAICTSEEKELIEEKVKAINEKYGIKKRWRAEEGNIYYFLNNIFNIMNSEENYTCLEDKRYENGNYFETEDEALEYAKYMKKCSLEWHEKRDDNE